MEWMLQAVYGYSITSVNMGKWLPIIIDRLAERTVVSRFSGERIGTFVTGSRLLGYMENDRLSITEAERGVGANVLYGQDVISSPSPRSDTALERFRQHIRRDQRGSTVPTHDTLHGDLSRPQAGHSTIYATTNRRIHLVR
jgi:hypothetical protein